MNNEKITVIIDTIFSEDYLYDEVAGHFDDFIKKLKKYSNSVEPVYGGESLEVVIESTREVLEKIFNDFIDNGETFEEWLEYSRYV